MVRGKCVPFRTFLFIMSRILSMSICLGKNFWTSLVVSIRSLQFIGFLYIGPIWVFHMSLKLCLPGMVNSPLCLYFGLYHFPINLSSYLLNLLHQEILVEVLHKDCSRVELVYVEFWGLLVVWCVWSLPVDAGVMAWVCDAEVAHSFMIEL